MPRGTNNLVIAALALLLHLLSPSAAHAHASLIASSPRDGSVVTARPEMLTLTFNEPVDPLALRLIDPRGASVALSPLRLQGSSLYIAPPAGLGEGTHVLSWRVVSADGHPVGGSVIFSIGKASASGAAVVAADTDSVVRVAIWTCRLVMFLGLFVGIGGSVFAAWFAPSPLPAAGKGPIGWVMAGGLVAAPLSVGLLGLDATAAPASALFQPASWAAGLATSYATTAAIAMIALALAAGALLVPGKTMAKVLSGFALLGVGAALSASGHASTAQPAAVAAVFLHAVGVTIWIGSLIPLLVLLHGGGDAARIALMRFSRAIPYALVPLVVAGLLLAVIQLEHVEALWTTSYGRVLSLKCLLLVGLFALAARNRYRLTPAYAGNAAAARPFTRSIAAELAIACAILATVSLWRFTPPPRSLAVAADAYLHIHTAKAMADVVIQPGRPGPVRVTIALATNTGLPLDAREVTAVLSNAAAGIEPISRPARKSPTGQWLIDLHLPAAGRWRVELDVLITDFDKTVISDEVMIGP